MLLGLLPPKEGWLRLEGAAAPSKKEAGSETASFSPHLTVGEKGLSTWTPTKSFVLLSNLDVSEGTIK